MAQIKPANDYKTIFMSCTVNKGKICWREINCGIFKSFPTRPEVQHTPKKGPIILEHKRSFFPSSTLGEKKCYSFEFHVRKTFVSDVMEVEVIQGSFHSRSWRHQPSKPSKLFIDIFLIYFFTFFHPVSNNMSLDVEEMCVGWCKWADTFINIRITSGECCSWDISLESLRSDSFHEIVHMINNRCVLGLSFFGLLSLCIPSQQCSSLGNMKCVGICRKIWWRLDLLVLTLPSFVTCRLLTIKPVSIAYRCETRMSGKCPHGWSAPEGVWR